MNESLAVTVVSSWMNRQQLMTPSLSHTLGNWDFGISFSCDFFEKIVSTFSRTAPQGESKMKEMRSLRSLRVFPGPPGVTLVLLLESESWSYIIVLLFKLLTRFPLYAQSESWPSYSRRPAVRCASEE